MNFFSQFRRTNNPHTSPEVASVNYANSLDFELSERALPSPQPQAFAYIATTDAVVDAHDQPAVSLSDALEDDPDSQPVQDAFLAQLFGLLFLVAFHVSVFVLKHVYVIALTLLSYVDRDVQVKYIKGACD